MTSSEIIRVILAVGLVVFIIAWRSGLKEWFKESKEKKKKEEEAKEKAAKKEAARKKAEQAKEVQARRTSQLLKLSLQGLEQKSVEIAGATFWYLEGGMTHQGPTVLLLHGFASQKEDWNDFAKPLLARKYHVVAPDLPGFGQNGKDPEQNFEVTTQAKRIRSLTKVLELHRIHLVGSSLGGSIAAAYTYGASADHVSSLTLIEPLGVRAPNETELDRYLARGINPMTLASPAAYDNRQGFLFVTPPAIPENVKQHRAQEATENRGFYLKMWGQIRGGDRAYLLDLLLPEIKTKTLVIQGEKSQVVHPATAQIIESRVPQARAVVVPECGHFPAIEKPSEVVTHFLSFVEET